MDQKYVLILDYFFNVKFVFKINFFFVFLQIKVQNSTKEQYLDSLAQYRLATTVKDEVDHFLKGLNDLIPDSLLSIFDENELEVIEIIKILP